MVQCDSSLVNGQQLICIKARHQKQRILKRLKQRGLAVGKIYFPKSYFHQTASKTCFLELIYYVYLLENIIICLL